MVNSEQPKVSVEQKDEQLENQIKRGFIFGKPFLALSLVSASVIAVILMVIFRSNFAPKSPEPATPVIRNESQVFQEVASQLGLTRSQLSYFRIFGQDRVQYSFGSGTNFAYKYNGKWQTAGEKNAQGVADCPELTNVPEKYRSVCYDSKTGQNKYMDASRQSVNYPPSQMVSYIGE